MVDGASALFLQSLPAAGHLTALRAQASAFLGCHAAMRAVPTDQTDRLARSLASRLRASLEPGRAAAWPWPEASLTYENALPVQGLIAAGEYLGSPSTEDVGLGLLDWLIDVQTASDGHFSPIGNGWWAREGVRSRFDQQPIEATALLLAARSAYLATRAERYRTAMERAYAWFVGQNDLGLPVADPERGACRDGLTRHGVNLNRGAESTLMWLMAVEHIRLTRAASSAPARSSVLALAPWAA
jgi:hypothetical protein